MAKGTYTLQIVTMISTDEGILDVDIDAGEVASFDLYGSTAYDQLQTQTSISVATAGLKTLKLRVHGQNGSSTGHVARFTIIALWRTA